MPVDTEVVLAIIGGFVAIASVIAGAIAQRDSRRSALQEAELLTKLDQDTIAAANLQLVLSMRIREWRDTSQASGVFLGLGIMLIGAALALAAWAHDPRFVIGISGIFLMIFGLIVMVPTAIVVFRTFATERLLEQLQKWATDQARKGGVDVPDELLPREQIRLAGTKRPQRRRRPNLRGNGPQVKPGVRRPGATR